MIPQTIAVIVAGLVSLINGWKEPVNLSNDLADAALALSTVEGVVPGVPLLGAALGVVQKAEAGLANLESGQAATVATDTVDGKTYSLVLVQNGGPAAQALGL